MKYELRRIGIFSAGKMSGTLFAAIMGVVMLAYAIIILLVLLLLGLTGVAVLGTDQLSNILTQFGVSGLIALIVAILIAVAIIVITWITGFIIGCIYAIVYNFLARIAGGIHVELNEK